MRIVAVLDVMAGQVVRGIAGQRERYRPWLSPLAGSSEPLDVARAFRERFGLIEIYVADLDAILGAPPNLPLLRSLQDDGFRLWVDAGMRMAEDVVPLREAGVARIVAGLETLAGPDVLAAIVADDVVFSLDLKDGEPLIGGDWRAEGFIPSGNPRRLHISGGEKPLRSSKAIEIARHAVVLGVTRMLVLDLSRVGVGSGPGTDELIANLRLEFPRLEVTAGGGVRGREDLDRLAQLGADAVLVASALHDGRLIRDDIAEVAS
jgi:phosphoribosylformimino-5-aminoimidazole carboxamide ribotide isomerase